MTPSKPALVFLFLFVALGAACGDDDDGATVDGAVTRDSSITERDAGIPNDHGGGELDDLGIDLGADPCDSPGAIETVTCGDCGTTERFCTSEGHWEVGTCTNEGLCAPGTTRAMACGNCGTQTERCTTECAWSPMGVCTDEGVCAPGETSRTSEGCPTDQSRERTCSDVCMFEGGACEADPCPSPGSIEDVPCGRCGTQERFCSVAGVWEYGACMGEGVCMPGTTDMIACGMCGMQSAQCTDRCTWSTTGSCTGEGLCSPGEQRRTSAGCPPDQTRLMECGASCGFTVQVEACSTARPIDILLLVDATPSNSFDVQNAAGTLTARCVDPLLAIPDAHVGLAYYGDHGSAPEPFAASVELDSGTGPAIGLALVTIADLGGGEDSTLSALDMLSGGPTATGAIPFTCSAGRVAGGCWRPGSQRVIILLTDEGARSGPSPTSTGIWDPWPATISPAWSTVGPALVSDGVRLYVANDIATIVPAGQYEEMVRDLGGVDGDVYYGSGMHGAHCDAIVAKVEALAASL